MANELLWFDVEKIGYTTHYMLSNKNEELWFDVEKIGYTTLGRRRRNHPWLWFDVEKIGYTTEKGIGYYCPCCGLM